MLGLGFGGGVHDFLGDFMRVFWLVFFGKKGWHRG